METRSQLISAREKLDAGDLDGAIAIYDAVLEAHGDEAEVLATVSGDLGATGHIAELIQLVALLYDPDRHGPAAGLNLLQAYLASGDVDAARHMLDLLVALDRPELEERLRGFEGAIAQQNSRRTANFSVLPPRPVTGSLAPPQVVARADLVSISKPIWFYGLEPLSGEILPPRDGRRRRIAFAQVSLSGFYEDVSKAGRAPEDEFGGLARALPLWLAETFGFSSAYAPIAAVAVLKEPEGRSVPLLFGEEWTVDNLRQLADTTEGGLDYIFTGVLSREEDGVRLLLRLWEVRKFRERKQFSARWTGATADAALTGLHAELCRFMEWKSDLSGGLAYAPPASPRAWLGVLAASLGLFLAGKKIFPAELLAPTGPAFAALGRAAADSPAASLAWLTLATRARALGLSAPPEEPRLAGDPIVGRARELLAAAG
jgi:hypothetical protein